MIDRVIAYILVFTMVIHPVPVYAQNVSAEISKDAEVFEGSENGEIVLTESAAEAESGMAGETEPVRKRKVFQKGRVKPEQKERQRPQPKWKQQRE